MSAISGVGPSAALGAFVPTSSSQGVRAAERLASLLATFGAATRAMAGAADRDSLAAAIVSLLVDNGAFAMAWIGADLDGDGWIDVIAASGDTGGYLGGIRISVHDAAEGHGPTGQAVRSGEPSLCADIASESRMEPWRAACLAHGFRSSGGFPLHSASLPTGVLSVYAPVAGTFGELEASVLADLARAVGFAFDDFAVRVDRAAAAASLRESEERYGALVEEAVARTERLEAVSRVAATSAHDFGNLLMAISIFQGFILEGLGPGHAHAADVTAIGEAVDRGRVIHAQLLSVGRDSPNEWQGRVDVLEVLDGLHGTLRAIAAPATLRIEADLAGPGNAPQVRIGQRALEHTVLNLVINARDAMTSRTGVITATVGSELVPASSDPELPEGRYVTVTVADDGPGMQSEVLDHAFVPFYTTKEHGTGLGLPSVLRTARRAGGTVRIESTPGVGTTVTLLLPVAAAE